ncbi:MAG: prephenate dehydrogenase/arogenate dehydrogenase family protein [Candidatus Omnitrophica bacterium CG07_land_8_20_14_0_80_42_15]|uniref:Prephenate dehydrogenase/arogenate dehydrogenase family protein n=1 Tax=Candidatus Aquitaenariimonas noxiae TaxID=1974741 RepID=A0A2J0KU39_9BACT|nr:MAG: prephenate dehydrogenase/arogenate dehydrogenase family protein [Candidatus Omnitrophica bacterium CG07_land_8_20_14_0_80_42_15]
MQVFKKVAIIGVGEVGGSIGKDLKSKRLAEEVIGVVRRKKSLKEAKQAGAVDRAVLLDRLGDGVKDADLIILATPVGKIIGLGKRAAASAKKGAIITDVGSTKKVIVEKLERSLPEGIKFVGSHPMAGSEKKGALNAEKDLFKGHNCFVTKTKYTDRDALSKIKRFWRSLGADVVEVSPGEHDKIVAWVSHLVHIAASSLVISNKDLLKFTASGFRDTTRIALSTPGLWLDICQTNAKEITVSLDKFMKILKTFRKLISKKNTAQLSKMLNQSRDLRCSLE